MVNALNSQRSFTFELRIHTGELPSTKKSLTVAEADKQSLSTRDVCTVSGNLLP